MTALKATRKYENKNLSQFCFNKHFQMHEEGRNQLSASFALI